MSATYNDRPFTFSTPELCALIGRQSSSTMDWRRVGKWLDLEPVGSGAGRERRYTARQAAIVMVAIDILDPANPARSNDRCRRVTRAMRERDCWSAYLVVNPDGQRWVIDPEQAVSIAKGHGPLTTTIVPALAYLERAEAALPEREPVPA